MRERLIAPEGLSVSRETAERLRALAELVLRWSRTVNLIGPSTADDLWSRHICDSVRLAPFLAQSERVADLGSGAGFPGLVVSIVCDLAVVLIESDRRKASFLREAIRVTASQAELHLGRVEELSGTTFSTLTARAFLPLDRLIAISRHLLAPGGRYLLLKGANSAAEVNNAARAHRFSTQIRSGTQRTGCVLEVRPILGKTP